MTGRAACQHLFAADLVIYLQLSSLGCVEIAIFPLHVVDLALRPNEILRCSVTCEAPFHLEGVLLENRRHIIDSTMAGRTADALRYVDTVIEIGIFRQIVYTLPFDGLIVTKACSYRLEVRAVRPYLTVAIHTRLRRGHACRRSRLNRLVAIATINTVVADMVLMAKLNGLLLFQISPRQIRRT